MTVVLVSVNFWLHRAYRPHAHVFNTVAYTQTDLTGDSTIPWAEYDVRNTTIFLKSIGLFEQFT